MTSIDRAAAMERLERFSRLLDSQFRVPGTDFRFGLDPLLGLIPGAGDVATLLLGLTIVVEAGRLGCSKPVLMRMVWHLLVDALAGSIPLFGDVFDAWYKSNRKNMELLRRDLARRQVK